MKRVQISEQEQVKTSRALHTFLETSTGFYTNLLSKLRARTGINLDSLSLSTSASRNASRIDESGVGATSPSASQLQASATRLGLPIFRILIRLGDLARYQRDLTGLPEADFLAAWSYYMDAQRLLPEQGMPYNQLAVLCTYSQDSIGALYYYARSLALPTPLETGKSNIEVLMRDASMTKYQEARLRFWQNNRTPNKRARGIGEGLEAGTKDSAAEMQNSLSERWKVFTFGFLGVHHSSTFSDLELVRANIASIIEDFQELVKSDWISNSAPSALPGPKAPSSSTYLQLVAYNMFALWSLAQQQSTLPPSSPEHATLLYRMQVTSYLSVSMVAVLIERAVNDLEKALPAQTNQSAASLTFPIESVVGRLELLPAICLFLDWSGTTEQKIVLNNQSSEENATFERFKACLERLIHVALPHASHFLSSPSSKALHYIPLPEETALNPFSPLEQSFENIDFLSLSTPHDSYASFQRRCHKIYVFAQRVVADPIRFSASTAREEHPNAPFAPSTHTALLSAETVERVESVAFTGLSTSIASQHAPHSKLSQQVSSPPSLVASPLVVRSPTSPSSQNSVLDSLNILANAVSSDAESMSVLMGGVKAPIGHPPLSGQPIPVIAPSESGFGAIGPPKNIFDEEDSPIAQTDATQAKFTAVGKPTHLMFPTGAASPSQGVPMSSTAEDKPEWSAPAAVGGSSAAMDVDEIGIPTVTSSGNSVWTPFDNSSHYDASMPFTTDQALGGAFLGLPRTTSEGPKPLVFPGPTNGPHSDGRPS